MALSAHRIRRPVAALAAAVTAAGLALLPPAPAAQAAESTPITITPNPASRGEAFEGWGTSLVWFANATAGYSPELREELYRKVFGEDGLNLNIARYNVGGGNASDVKDYLNDGSAVEGWWKPATEATPGQPASNLYNPDGSVDKAQANKLAFLQAWNPEDPASYNPDADQNQRWWVERLAQDQQITHWEAFSNSPPWFMTKSGYVSGQVNTAKGENLLPEAEGKFASYMRHAVELLEKGSGIKVDTIDPFNEPNSGYWGTDINAATGKPPTTYTQKQEGALIYPAAQDRVTKLLAAELAKGSTDAVISAMDETDPAKFMTNWNGYSQEAKNAVAQLNVHTYGTNDRRRVRDLAGATDKPLWMSEVGGFWTGNPALGDSTSGWDRSNITNGLGIAGRMVNDLRELDPNAWVFWQPVEDTYKQEKADKGWGSIYVDFDCNYAGREGYSNRRINDGDTPDAAKCKVLTNQKYNTTRNFTHYIRPGDFLIQNNDPKTASALRADGNGATLVHFNDTPTPEKVTIDLSRFGSIAPGATVTPVVTTKSPLDDIEKNALVKGAPVTVNAGTKSATLEVPAASVVTFVVDGVSGVSDGAAPVQDGHSYHLSGEASGKYLTAGSGSGASIQDLGTDAAGVAPQIWTFNAVTSGDEFAKDRRWVVTGKDGRVLTGNGGVLNGSQSGAASLASLTLEQAKATPAAQWMVTTENGKQWTLVNAAAAIALQVSGNQTATGTSVALASSTGTTATALASPHQAWAFTDIADLKLLGVSPVDISTPVGTAPVLPTTVNPVYEAGTGKPLAVAWTPVDPASWDKAGKVTVYGSGVDPYGQAFEAVLTITVGAYIATDPVSVTVGVGESLASVQASAPVTVPAQIADGPSRNPLPVSWDWSSVTESSLQAEGKVAVPGTANGLPATLTVIVVDRVPVANICKEDPATIATASYTEGSYLARNTCDAHASTRWSNWVSGGHAGDSLSYGFARDYAVSSVTVTSAEKAATSLKVQYQDAAGVWKDTSAGTVTGLSTSSPTTVSFDPVTTRGVRVSFVTTASYTKVAEVAIAGTRLADAGLADLGRLLVNQSSVVGFTPGTTSYRALTPTATPAVVGYPLDSNAKVAVRQATAESPTAVVTVAAPDGTVKVYQVAVFTGKDACKDDGWKTSPSPVFKNQGQCVSSFAAGM
ncbi:Ig domain protein [Pseudarthrobacter chlorophenolicus A6]|uniref:Ig domain protein n=1 Tax=Pseudarthrobacter chlorophenolicus (strain ATCC 700700 / DSM 12829 / CIP 107037 / JCM 12360 / KCTC 9906 / NCIMB 13794 / A6) TaxID=452863 RepID=B8H6Z0_PSECP|nr:Ig-like domain-containing protein [Pseudarthrobacter chlorophenolicus]ACL39711.1 Ig domain protein [Pseudarthrobacter chlorophenolicus A6]SDQ94974.1 Ig-like domain (group 4) [Pseudarthrobacter chlorophenolicus]